jgi:dipeptidyl aminopeptidase/acylaminoacyl peptidase
MTWRFPFHLHRSIGLCCFAAAVAFCCCFSPGHAQQLDKPLQSIDEEITAFAFAPDGRIVFAVNRGFKTKKYDLEHDDIWMADANGKRKRIFQGDKFTRGDLPFTYAANTFKWSSNGRLLLAEFFTTTLDETGKAEDSINTLILEDGGKEVRPGGTESFLKNASDATWQLDNATFVYLAEVLKPKVLFSFKQTNIGTGPAGNVFEGRTFLDADAVPRSNAAIAVERDRALTGPPRLQRLEMASQEDAEIATLDGYEGGLRVSPSGKKVLYFVDKEVLEIRDLETPSRVARLRIGLGVPRWAPDESRIFVKRSIEKKSGSLVAVDVPPLAASASGKEVPIVQPEMTSLLHGVTIREFAISPDGRFLGIIAPGKRNLLVFALPGR